MLKKVILVVMLILALACLGVGIGFYKIAVVSNVSLQSDTTFLLIPTGSDYKDVKTLLADRGILKSNKTFDIAAGFMKYKDKVKSGRYLLVDGMSNKQLILKLRSGSQEPMKLVFNVFRKKETLAGKLGEKLEADSLEIIKLLNNKEFLAANGFNENTVIGMFVPNTYEFYWNTSAEELFMRMKAEYENFWNEERRKMAASIKLTPAQVLSLASIVEQETHQKDEKPIVAGVYMNRLRKGWTLDADPTLIYALNDFNIRRVLNEHKKVESPYNTYMNAGLPPGPICIPSIESVNAVLHYARHDFMYFCAKEDFSGYHNFASNYIQHLINARKFQRELNRRKIK